MPHGQEQVCQRLGSTASDSMPRVHVAPMGGGFARVGGPGVRLFGCAVFLHRVEFGGEGGAAAVSACTRVLRCRGGGALSLGVGDGFFPSSLIMLCCVHQYPYASVLHGSRYLERYRSGEETSSCQLGASASPGLLRRTVHVHGLRTTEAPSSCSLESSPPRPVAQADNPQPCPCGVARFTST